MRIATCTPVDFPADVQFFGRDSGLLCRGFQNAGHEAFVVMPGSIRQDDMHDVTRCTPDDLESITWWRTHRLDLVVFYAWGDPRYRKIAEAIRAAGIYLVQSLDTAGLTTPYGNRREWWQCLTGLLRGPQRTSSRIRRLAKACRDLLPYIFEHKRLAMIDCSDAVALVSEPAARSVAEYASALGYPEIAKKLIIAPHPVSPVMVPGTETKLKKVLVVGRWAEEDRHQKDPELTIAVIGDFLAARPDWTAEVVGKGSTALHVMTIEWEESVRKRLTLNDAIPRPELAARYQQSSILLCASRFESFHISSAEALCCGCSIVVAAHPLLASTGWFTTRNSGSLARSRKRPDMVATLKDESELWNKGHRDATVISQNWCHCLLSKHVAHKIIGSAIQGEVKLFP